MRVLLLIIQFPPDVNSTGLLMDQVCQGLVDRGHEVSVLTTFPHYEKFRVWDEYRGKLFERSAHRQMNVLRVWVYASGAKNRMFHRLLSYLSFACLSVAAGVLSSQRPDVILCTNGSFFSGLSAWIIGAAKQVPFVWNVQDLYPEVPVRTGQLKNRFGVKLLECLERFIYRRAAHLAVITPSFKENLMGKEVPEPKVTVIPNFVDTEFIRPLPKDNPFSREHDLVNKFVVMHAGNVGYVYDLDTMLDCAARLRDHPEIVFLIVGDGVARSHLERRVQEMALPNVRFLPFQPREHLPLLRASADVQVSLNRRGSSSHSMPSKIYEIMASGRPLIASTEVGSDVRALVEATECGLCVDPEDVDQLTAAVLRLHREPDLCEWLGAQGRRSAEQHYSRDAVVEQYELLLRRVSKREGQGHLSLASDPC